MKKMILTITSLFILFACSDEYIKETENTLPTTYTIDPGIPYESPFDAQICCSGMIYHFINESDLDFSFIPYIGLARYDGINDNDHFGVDLTLSPCPNILRNGMEYLDLIECLPVVIDNGTSKFYNNNLGQLPMTYPDPDTAFYIAYPEIPDFETGFLSEYGKFYSFEATITDPVSGNTVINEYLKFPFLPEGVTDPTTLSPNWSLIPSVSPETEDLWYHQYTFEICVGNDHNNYPGGGLGLNDKPSIVEFSYNGREYRLEAYTTASEVIVSLSFL